MAHFFSKRKLSFPEIMLLPKALLSLFIFRLKVSYQPSKKWMPKASLDSVKAIDLKKRETALLVVKVINGLENRTLWENTCLVKALAAHSILHQKNITSNIHIGIASKLDNQLDAHAWLSVGAEIILGGESLDSFQEISSFN